MHARPRRRLAATILVVVPALVLVGCASAAHSPSASEGAPPVSPSTGATPAPKASRAPVIPDRVNALMAVGRAGNADLEVIEATSGHTFLTFPIGAPDASWGHILSAAADGDSTMVRNDVLESPESSRRLRIDGQWRLPTIGRDPIPSGRSADGSTLVLVEPRTGADSGSPTSSRFAVVRAPIPPSVAPLELARIIELPGAFDFDALSANGSILYVIEHLDDGAGGAYQVRSVDVASGRMDAVPVANKSDIDETMAGQPITQQRQSDGMVYTLYRGSEHPFVHALSSNDKWAICIDLPATGQADAAAADDWALTPAANGRSVFAVNATLGLVAEIDPSELSVRRQGIFGETSAAAPRIVLAKFGHGPTAPLGRRAVTAPNGETIAAGGRAGLVGLRPDDFSVAWRALPGESIRAVGSTSDGSAAYALTGSGRIVAISMTDGEVLGDVPGGGFDRLAAIMGG